MHDDSLTWSQMLALLLPQLTMCLWHITAEAEEASANEDGARRVLGRLEVVEMKYNTLLERLEERHQGRHEFGGIDRCGGEKLSGQHEKEHSIIKSKKYAGHTRE